MQLLTIRVESSNSVFQALIQVIIYSTVRSCMLIVRYIYIYIYIYVYISLSTLVPNSRGRQGKLWLLKKHKMASNTNHNFLY